MFKQVLPMLRARSSAPLLHVGQQFVGVLELQPRAQRQDVVAGREAADQPQDLGLVTRRGTPSGARTASLGVARYSVWPSGGAFSMR